MNERLSRKIPPLMAVLAAILLATGSSAQARGLYPEKGVINVNVSFNSYLPLPDESDQAIARTQKHGRSFVYRMATEECEVLKASIAASCNLTHINVSSRVQEHTSSQPLRLYLNGTATFTITLKKF